jgi:hypothetical protein
MELSLIGTRRLYVKDAVGGVERVVDDEVNVEAIEVRFGARQVLTVSISSSNTSLPSSAIILRKVSAHYMVTTGASGPSSLLKILEALVWRDRPHSMACCLVEQNGYTTLCLDDEDRFPRRVLPLLLPRTAVEPQPW